MEFAEVLCGFRHALSGVLALELDGPNFMSDIL